MIETTSLSFISSPTQEMAVELEWHCLDKRYEHLRQRTPQAQRRMTLSICTYGLLTPINVIPAQSPSQWIVIDGYLRIQAMRQLGKDTIAAQCTQMSAEEALMTLYRVHQSRPWEPLEEAALLQELITHHHYSQAQCAQKLGKSQSWVSYRLQLLDELPEFVRHAVYQGVLSGWVASRVMIPFARANARHAQQFLEYLAQHSHSSRESQLFYEHYMRAHPRVREKMMAQPALFFKVQVKSNPSLLTTTSKKGDLSPQHQWEQRLARIIQELYALRVLIPQLFDPHQAFDERHYLEQPFEQAHTAMNTLKETLRRIPYASQTHGSDRTTTPPSRPQPTSNQPAVGHLTQ